MTQGLHPCALCQEIHCKGCVLNFKQPVVKQLSDKDIGWNAAIDLILDEYINPMMNLKRDAIKKLKR